jgi:hypothetical protein
MARAKSTEAERLKRTAFHEAGHAVAAFYLLVRIKHVTIIPTADTLGHMKGTRVQFTRQGVFDDSLRGTDRAGRHIMVCWAGQLAQRKLAPHSRWRLDGAGDTDLAMELFSHIDSHDEKARNLQVALLWRRTQLLVELRWKEIQAVAAALLRRKTLKADDIREVVKEALGLKPFKPEGAAPEAVSGSPSRRAPAASVT